MRAPVLGFTLLAAVIAASAIAQTPTAPAAAPAAVPSAPAMTLFASSSEVTALIAKVRASRKEGQNLVTAPILSLAPYRASLEYRPATAPASLHEKDAEMFYVIEGTGTIVTGGKLTDETRTNAANLSGTSIAGGNAQAFAKGDFIIVPENTPHQITPSGGPVFLMALHVPRPTAWP